MAEEIQAQPTQQQGDQPPVQVVLDERDLKITFSNSYRVYTTAEEVVLDFGFNMPNPNPQGATGPQLLFKVNDRIIMSYPNMKRLSISLTQLVRRLEQQFGEIPAQPGQGRAPQAPPR